MGRSPSSIEHEAREIGKLVTSGNATGNSCIQVLAALIEELAQSVQRLQDEVDTLKRQ